MCDSWKAGFTHKLWLMTDRGLGDFQTRSTRLNTLSMQCSQHDIGTGAPATAPSTPRPFTWCRFASGCSLLLPAAFTHIYHVPVSLFWFATKTTQQTTQLDFCLNYQCRLSSTGDIQQLKKIMQRVINLRRETYWHREREREREKGRYVYSYRRGANETQVEIVN